MMGWLGMTMITGCVSGSRRHSAERYSMKKSAEKSVYHIIEGHDLSFRYLHYDENGETDYAQKALDGVDLEVEKGQFIAILGHNGSGKSTLARHLNALLLPEEGTLFVNGYDTRDESRLWDIRQSAGMVFQNPDNQIIASVVEEDVGFGPENMGVPTDDIWKRVENALCSVGMWELRDSSPNRLSGGQKQRIAIAGVLAMKPKCIVLDEPTAMLDPGGRKEVIRTVLELNRTEGVTVILITHYMEEVVDADRVIVMDHGRVVLTGTPRQVFSQVDLLRKYRLDVPQVTLLAHELKTAGLDLPDGVLSTEELVRDLNELRKTVHPGLSSRIREKNDGYMPETSGTSPSGVQPVIRVEHLDYIYNPGTSYEKKALDDISLTVSSGEFVGIIGHTGCGKSTLVQHLNGLNRPSSGKIIVDGEDISAENYPIRQLRFKVGLVFQYPEYQLFESDILKDVCFGPKNQGLSEAEQIERARAALRSVGLDESFENKSPFDLSGGQKRRAAIAGILAMDPKVLILDEPTAGMDPKGRDEILNLLKKLHEERDITILLVSHSMEDMANYVNRIIVMNEGRILYDDIPRRIFACPEELERIGLAAPQVTYVMDALVKNGWDIDASVTTIDEAGEEILAAVRPDAAAEGQTT